MRLSIALFLLLSTSAAAAAPNSLNSSIPQNTYTGLGCNESNFFGEDITSSFVAVEENVFCEGDIFPGQEEAYIGKFTTTCNDTDGTVLLQWYQCNSTDCSENCDTTSSATWVSPMSVWVEATKETCFDMNLLPPYSPLAQEMNWTAISFMYTEDPSPYTQILVENSCISTYLSSDSMDSSTTPSPQTTSSGEWVGLSVCWFYVVASAGFAVLFG